MDRIYKYSPNVVYKPNKMPNWGIQSVGHIGQQRQKKQVKSITELPNSLSFQSTETGFLPIYMIRYQW